MTGKFITLEGIEGLGKSTNLQFVTEYLRNRGKTVVTTREPGGTPVGERLRDVLLNSERGSVPDTCELLMMFAARDAHLEQVIRPALERGDWVVCDRFTDATFAYQGGGRGLADDVIESLQAIVQRGLTPDLTLLLDASIEVSEQRRIDRGHRDRFESEEIDFFQRVRARYLAIAAADSQRVRVVDAAQPLAKVQAVLATALEQILESD